MTLTESGQSALEWTTATAATISVAARFFVRYKTRAIEVEDYLMLASLAWVFIAAALAQSTVNVPGLTDSDRARSWAIHTVATLASFISLYCSKTSVGLLLLRLIPKGTGANWQRLLIFATLAVLPCLAFLAALFNLVPSCGPVQLSVEGDNACFEYDINSGIVSAWNWYSVFFDITYSILPAMTFYRLQMPASRKISLSILLGLGWTAAIFTLLRTIVPYVNWDLDTIDTIVPIATWMEMTLVIMCGSLATLHPLYRYWKAGEPLRPRDQFAASPIQTVRPVAVKPSRSTVAAEPLTQEIRFADRGIRVEREFGVTSMHEDVVLAV